MSTLDVYGDDGVDCRFCQSVGYKMDAMHIHDVYEIYMA